MKKILFCALSVWCATAFGQVPSFRSFNPPQFSTNNFIVSLKDPLVVTNITVVSNVIAQTIYTTNLYTTNLYVTNIFNDITFNGRVTFNTNVTFVTNVAGASFGSAGWFAPVNYYWTNLQFELLSSGLNDLLTSPPGYRTYISKIYGGTTNQAGLAHTGYVKTNAVYYPVTTQNTLQTNNGAFLVNGIGIPVPILEPGETFAVSNSVDGWNGVLSAFVFTNSLACYSPRVFDPVAGDHVIYVVPTNRIAMAMGLSAPDNTGGTTSPNLFFVNRTGANLNIRHHITQAGQATNFNNLFNQRVVGANATLGMAGAFATEGQAYIVNTDSSTAGQSIWITIFELEE